MKPTYFISDLHLSPDLPRVTAGFMALVDHLEGNAEALYVLGDLFEAWVGDDNLSDYNRRIIEAFARLGVRGTAVYFLHGNRDFLIGDEFVKSCRGFLLPERQVIQCYGYQVLVEHGDALCTLDEKYQTFRAQSRHPLWQQGMLAKPLGERVQIAEQWRAQSRLHNSNKPENIMDVTPQAVIDTMLSSQVSLMVHGHTHRPQQHEVDLGNRMGQRLVLGDWREDEGSAVIAMADEKGIRLSDWSF
ncbi:MAG TPA: UDP-2,3-diacylglucosamine diphosphatase [Fluviicoccus sp.]|nr:UDP-2,3-diacylglucosamine diphosphatase [Fluviicoccus sp.]